MNILKVVKENRQYLASTGKLGVWIPLIEPAATAGEFYQPDSGWNWTGAVLYVLPSGKLVHVQGDWSAVQGESDSQTVTVYQHAAEALADANKSCDEYDCAPAYLADLLRKSGVIEHLPTLA
jgi:hypothetical protein